MPVTTPNPTAQSTAKPAQTMGSSTVIPSRRRAIARFRGSRNPSFHRQHPETECDPDDLPEAAHEREGHAGLFGQPEGPEHEHGPRFLAADATWDERPPALCEHGQRPCGER